MFGETKYLILKIQAENHNKWETETTANSSSRKSLDGWHHASAAIATGPMDITATGPWVQTLWPG